MAKPLLSLSPPTLYTLSPSSLPLFSHFSIVSLSFSLPLSTPSPSPGFAEDFGTLSNPTSFRSGGECLLKDLKLEVEVEEDESESLCNQDTNIFRTPVNVVVFRVLNNFAFFHVIGDVTDTSSSIPTHEPGTETTPTDQGSGDDENSGSNSGMWKILQNGKNIAFHGEHFCGLSIWAGSYYALSAQKLSLQDKHICRRQQIRKCFHPRKHIPWKASGLFI